MIIRIASSFTRPADITAYASGDLVANSTTAGSVTPLSFDLSSCGRNIMLKRIKLHHSSTSITNTSFRAHFFQASPTVANGDNAAFSSNKVADYMGSYDVTMSQAFTDGAAGFGVETSGFGDESHFNLYSNTVYALLEARAAYTPTSAEVFTLTPEFIIIT